MCNLDDAFILCTCSGKKRQSDAAFTWSLFRPREDDSDLYVIGEAGAPYFSEKGKLLVDKVQEQLNARNCFDFDYQPKDGDTLVITSSDNGTEYGFMFYNDEWEYTTMPFEGRTLLKMEKGKIK